MTINDPEGMNGNSRPGIYSYFVGTGEPSWFYEVQPECNDERSERLRRCESLGFSATPLSIDGAVITGGLDGRLFVFNSESGELIYQYDTVRDYETINGVEDMVAQLIVILLQQDRVWFLLDQDTVSFVRCRAMCFWHLSPLNNAWLVLN